MSEIWKPVVGYESRYEVSSIGRVRSKTVSLRYTHWRSGEEHYRVSPQSILSQQKSNSGYLLVSLHLDNRRRVNTVHRLVAEAFIANDGHPEVNHKDGNKANNSIENLEWISRSENKRHAVVFGLNTQAIPVACPRTGRRYPSITQAAAACGVSHKTVSATFLRTGCAPCLA